MPSIFLIMSRTLFYNFILFFIIFSLLSCKTTPIVYDGTINAKNREIVLINVLIENKRYEEAESKIRENILIYPKSVDFPMLLGWLFLIQHKYNESEAAFNQVLDTQKNIPLVYLGLAKISRFKNSIDNAFYYVDKGLKYSRSIPELFLERGILFYQTNQNRKAINDFNTVLILDYKNIEASLYKYLILLSEGEEIDSIKHYWEKVLEATPLEEYYFLYHADVLSKREDYLLADGVLMQGLSYFPNGVYLLNSYAYFLYENYTRAIDSDEKYEILKNAFINIEKCIKIAEENNLLEPYFLDTYFLILEAKGEKDTVKNTLRKYIYLYPDSIYLIEWTKKYGL